MLAAAKRIAFIAALALPMQIFIGWTGDSIVTVLLPYNSFVCTHARRGLAEIIFLHAWLGCSLETSCLAEPAEDVW